MSRITSAVLRTTHGGAVGASLTTGVTAWVYTSWVELIASTSAIVHIAGLSFDDTTVISSRAAEFEIGVGGAGSEVAIGTFYGICISTGSNNGMPLVWMADKPFGAIPASSRVAIRMRVSTNSATVAGVSLHYYEGLVATGTSWHTTRKPVGVPVAAAPASITPSGSSWTNSSWVEVTSGLGFDFILRGITYRLATASPSFEFDIGTGAGGAESVITTARGAASGTASSGMTRIAVPPITIAGGTRIAARFRHESTNNSAIDVGLYGTDDTPFSVGGGTVIPVFHHHYRQQGII